MTQGPWSVKGIDPKARSLARERAQRRGVTLGEYLNTLLLDEDDAGVGAETSITIAPRQDHARAAPADELRRMSSEIDNLTQKLEATQARTARSMAGVDKSILGLMSKMDTSGKAQLGALERVARAMSEIETTQTALRSRIETLETEDSSTPTMSALRSLESSLTRLAEAVQERIDTVDDKIGRVSERVETQARGADRIDHVENQLVSVERRVDGALSRINDAAQRLEHFESKAERTAQDANWRMERALESGLSRSRQMSKGVLDRVEAIEEKNRETVNALSDALARVTDRLSRAERKHDTVADVLQRSMSDIDERMARMGSSDNLSTLQKRLETLAEDLSRPMHAMRQDVERRIEEAARAAGQPEKMEKLERSFRQVQEQLQESEARQQTLLYTVNAHTERLTKSVEDRLAAAEARDGARTLETVRREMMALADTIEARLAETETEARGAADGVARLNDELSRRMADAEQRTVGLIDEVGSQVASVAERLQRRHDESIQRVTARMEEQHASGLGPVDFDKLTERLDERVRDSERRSAEAIGQIGEQVARVADRLQTQHQESVRMIEARLAQSDRSHEARLSEVLGDVARRMDEIGEQSASTLNPVHNTLSSIARRIEALEDGSPTSNAAIAAVPAATLLDDDLILIDDDPDTDAHHEDPLEALEKAAADAGMFDEDLDIVGVDPPPFDPVSEEQLFEAPLEVHVGTGATLDDTDNNAQGDKPAQRIDDLLDMDDMVFGAAAAGDGEFVGDLPADDDRERASNAYLTEARQAARQGRRYEPDASNGRRGIGRGPLIASAALAVAVAGGGAWTVLRGKQDPAADDFARLDPSAPETMAGDPQAAVEMLFPADPTESAAVEPASDMFEQADAAPASIGAPAVQAGAVTVTPPQASGPMTLAQAVIEGDPVALHDQAQEYLQSGEKARGVTLMREAAAKGLVVAQYRLAKLHERGEGVPRDIAASRQWTERAAIGGNVNAMHDLAVFYAEGDGGPQSYAAAIEWFRQASDLGLVDSQYNLAVLYEQGLGVSQDKTEAAFWYEIASRAGDTDAARKARALMAEMSPADAEILRRKARAFSPRTPLAYANGDFGKRAWETTSSSQTSEIQRLLQRMGYSVGATDGRVDARTTEAIRQFERDNDLPVTGDPTTTLLRQLKAASLVSAG